MRIRSTLFVLAGFLPVIAFAQHNFGMATSDYSVLNSLYLNPASIAGSNERIVVSLVSLNVSVDNNLTGLSSLGDIGNGSFTGQKYFSAILPAIDMHLPGLVLGFNDKLKQSVALTTRIRGIDQFNHFSQDLYTTIKSNDRSSGQDYRYQAQDFNWTVHVWNELALTYALVPWQSGPHQIKAGITLKYLGGIDYLSLKGKNLDVEHQAGSDSFYASNSDLEFASNAISSNNAYANGVSASGIIQNFFGAKAGGGAGLDVGISYSYKIGADDFAANDEEEEADVHMLRLGVSVMDIGSIKYKTGNNFVAQITGNGYLTGNGLSDHLKSFSDLQSYARSQGYTVDTGSMATKLYMPAAMIVNADCQVYKRAYLSVIYFSNLANRQNYGNSYYNQITFVPRYDSRIFTASMPITFSSLASDVKVGIGLRVSGFFIGSDDVMAAFNNNAHGLSFYAGGYIPIYRKDHGERNSERGGGKWW